VAVSHRRTLNRSQRLAATAARALALAVLAMAACYDPHVIDCVITCSRPGDCGPGQVCGADGRCARPEVAGSCALDAGETDGRGPSDGMIAPDGAPPADGATMADASVACNAVCTAGVCESGVCVIRCGDHGCDQLVVCPAAVPCRVECSGNHACTGGIVCGPAACTVECGGNHACGGAINCANSCACDVQCSGNQACGGGLACPVGCSDGTSCRSTIAGCDRC